MLVAFAYAFEHKKTYEGLMALLAHGLKPDLVVAADFKSLSVKRSPTRVGPQGLSFPTAERVCSEFSVDYVNSDHDSSDLVSVLAERQPTTGVILGARILKQDLISVFSKGILNLHPGVLPENRGLDNLKWAVSRGLPQGVTSHLIDSQIDRGRLIEKQIVDVYQDDSLLDINLRIQNIEMKLMVQSLVRLESNELSSFAELSAGEYNTAMDADVDSRMLTQFDRYKRDYSIIKASYLASDAGAVS